MTNIYALHTFIFAYSDKAGMLSDSISIDNAAMLGIVYALHIVGTLNIFLRKFSHRLDVIVRRIGSVSRVASFTPVD